MVLIDQFLGAQEPLLAVPVILRRNVLVPVAVILLVPGLGLLCVCELLGHRDANPAVEVLGIEPVPPLALAIGLGQEAIVGNILERPLDVVPVRHLQPMPCMGRVIAHAEPKAVLAGDLGPNPDDVLVGAHIHGVPRLIGGVIAVEIVVMVRQGHEVVRPRPNIEIHQLLRVPVLRGPGMIDVLEAHLGGMAVVAHLPGIVGRPLHVQPPGIPVALLGHALRRPVRPDTELRVAEPLRALVALLERFPGRLERTGCDYVLRGFPGDAGLLGKGCVVRSLVRDQGRAHHAEGQGCKGQAIETSHTGF